MIRVFLVALALVSIAPAQFVEIEVDTAAVRGVIRPTFGIDAPEDEALARNLLAGPVELPVRVGPAAALRDRLAQELSAVHLDDEARPRYEIGLPPPDVGGLWLWGRQPPPSPEEAIAAGIQLQDAVAESAYYDCRTKSCFREGGAPSPLVSALELGARMAATPRRLPLRAGADTGILGLAGVSEDGQTVQVLLSRGEQPEDEEPAPEPYVLYVRNLPWGAKPFRIERYRFDGERPASPTATGQGRGGLARVSAPFPPPAIELIVLRREDPAPGADILLKRKAPAR